MAWIQKNQTNNISLIVQNRTHMSESQLLNDTKVYHYNNLDQAADLYMKHVQKGSKIGCFADYDTDGITSDNIQRLLAKALRINDFYSIVPGRFSDGYGIKERHIDEFKDFDLLLLCDNGIAAVEAVKKAKDYGIEVIILDHHQSRVDKTGKVILPPADVIVDPHITGGDFDDLCGAGISYRFAEAVFERCSWMSDKQKWFFLSRMSCFAALGTVGDVVSLTYDNRKIVKEGIKNLNKGYATTGLKTLCREAKIYKASSTVFGYFLSPIINASGRMYDNGPKFISNLISYDVSGDLVDNDFLSKCCKAIETNDKRKEIEALAVERDFNLIDTTELKDNNFIVIIDSEITTGIVGLVSGKITEKYHRPSIVLTETVDKSLVKGSGRSIEDIDLKSILDKNNSLIEVYGGHAQACGITLNREKLDEFIKKINECTPKYEACTDIFYDVECTLQNAIHVYQEIEKFEPYGQGNPGIKVLIRGVEPDYSKSAMPVISMGADKQHLKIIADGMEFVWFNHAEDYRALGSPEKVDVIGTLGVNSFNGIQTLQMTVEHLRKAE